MGNPKWTLERFLEKSAEIHGEKYDYSAIVREDIKGYRSKVPLTCKACFYEWSPSINDHIYNKSGCPSCKSVAPWTLARFLDAANKVHGEKYNYGLITDKHICGKTSKVPIICNTCAYQWEQQIAGHINSKQGCPDCAGNAPMTLQRFYEKAHAIYGNTFDYSQVTEEDARLATNRVIIICRECAYNWNTTIGNFLYREDRGCPDCNGHAHWNLHRFLLRATEIHGDIYDYSLITEEHVVHSRSQVPIRCKNCVHVWWPDIHSHISREIRCPNCRVRATWTLSRFLYKGKLIHGERYNYSQVTEAHIENCYSKVPVWCTICQKTWSPTINNHINNKSGCRNCTRSKGELKCEEVLNKFQIPFETEYTLPTLHRRYFDFMFELNGKKYLLEFDGVQHFQHQELFDYSEEDLKKRQKHDIQKSKHALKNGYLIIRIDHTQLHEVETHLIYAVNLLKGAFKTYYSTVEMYDYISKELNVPVIQFIPTAS